MLDGFAAVGLVGVVWFFLNAGEFDPWMYRGGFTVLALFTALLLAGTVHPASRLAPAVFGFALFRWIGVRSYGIYLWHWPIYQITRPHADVPFTGIPLLLVRIGLTFGAATLSFKYVEEPIRAGAIGRQYALYRHVARRAADAPAPSARRGRRRGRAVARDHRRRTRWRRHAGTTARPSRGGATRSSSRRPTAVDPATTTLVPNAAPYRVLAIGDSVMLGAAQQLFDAINPVKPVWVDAAESRQFFVGVDDLQGYADRGELPNDVVVVHLGTNGLDRPGRLRPHDADPRERAEGAHLDGEGARRRGRSRSTTRSAPRRRSTRTR